jgi:large subunit ribosomal protein L17
MVTSLISHERITTTDSKAKELRSIAEKMITLGKRGDLHALRQASAYIREKQVVTKLFTSIAPRYKERSGGYTRIIKLGLRPGDNAPMSLIELVEEQFTPKAKKVIPATKPVQKVVAAVASQEEVVEEVVSSLPVEESTCEAKAD